MSADVGAGAAAMRNGMYSLTPGPPVARASAHTLCRITGPRPRGETRNWFYPWFMQGDRRKSMRLHKGPYRTRRVRTFHLTGNSRRRNNRNHSDEVERRCRVSCLAWRNSITFGVFFFSEKHPAWKHLFFARALPGRATLTEHSMVPEPTSVYDDCWNNALLPLSFMWQRVTRWNGAISRSSARLTSLYLHAVMCVERLPRWIFPMTTRLLSRASRPSNVANVVNRTFFPVPAGDL